MKPIEEEIERKKEELKSKEEMFCGLNQFMEDVYSGHRWCKLSLKERRRIYFEQPRGTIDYSNRFLPKFIPFDEEEFDLLGEVTDLFGAVIKAEILRRRKLTMGKIKNN